MQDYVRSAAILAACLLIKWAGSPRSHGRGFVIGMNMNPLGNCYSLLFIRCAPALCRGGHLHPCSRRFPFFKGGSEATLTWEWGAEAYQILNYAADSTKGSA